MKTIITTLFSLSISIVIWAIDPHTPFNSHDQIDPDYQEKYPDADAVCLFDMGQVRFVQEKHGYDFEIEFTRTKRIMILKNAGAAYAEISIPFYIGDPDRKEAIIEITGMTSNLVNGEVEKTELHKKAIYEEVISKDYHAMKCALPNVRVGSVIEYTYTLRTPYIFSLPKWYFQSEIPTEFSQYVARMIPFYEYNYVANGIDTFDYHNVAADREERRWGTSNRTYAGQDENEIKFNDIIHTFVMRDIPAFTTYPFLPCPEDYVMQMQFQLSTFNKPGRGSVDIANTWSKLNKDLLKSEFFGYYEKKASSTAKKVLDTQLSLEGLGELQKAKVIIEYVKNSINHDGLFTKYCRKSPEEVYAEGTGNGTEINLFLVAMLREAGIEAIPVLLSTKDHGRINTDHPYFRDFNHTVVLVANSFLADASSRNTSFGKLPVNCLNGNGLLVTEEDELWVPLEPGIMSYANYNFTIEIDPQVATAAVSVMVQSTEYASVLFRDSFEDDKAKISERFNELQFEDIEGIRTFNFEQKEKPYILGLKGSMEFDKAGDAIFVKPFLNFPMAENQLTLEHRNYPVDFLFPKSNSFEVVISIPDGYEPIDLPKSINISKEGIDFNVEYLVTAGSIEVKAAYTFEKSIYLPEEYSGLKASVEQIAQVLEGTIALNRVH